MPVFDWPAHARTRVRLVAGAARARARAVRPAADRPLPRARQVLGAAARRARIRRDGSWGEGPGIAFFDAARERLDGLPLIVEDLGHITPDVIELREAVGVPGMNVVARVADIDWRTDSVLYTSTHDSDTLAGWWQRWGRDNQPQLAAGATSTEGEHRALLQNVLAVENELVIIPAQDLLGLGTEARMNRPGTTDPRNWQWRLEQPLTDEQADTLASWTAAAGRGGASAARAA